MAEIRVTGSRVQEKCSVCEFETQMMISGDLGYMGKERLQELREAIGDIERMLKGLIKSLENKHLNP